MPGGSARALTFWESAKGDKLAECSLTELSLDPSILGWSPDSRTLAVSSGKGIALFQAPWKTLHKNIARPRYERALAWSPGGKFLAIVGQDSHIRVIDLALEQSIQDITGHKLAEATFVPAWSPDGKELAFGTTENQVVVWDTRKQKAIYTLIGHTRPINAVAYLGDGKTLVSASAAGLRFWDLEKGSLRGTFLVFGGSAWVAISPEGYYRASGNAESLLKFKAREENNQLRAFSAGDFRQLYGWKNEPERVRLTGE
jgi:WD40 repeat protein